jgi:hypothetical protein
MKIVSALFILMIPSVYQVSSMNRVVPDSGDKKTIISFNYEKNCMLARSLPKDLPEFDGLGTYPTIIITDDALSVDGVCDCFCSKTPPFVKAINGIAQYYDEFSVWITHTPSLDEEEFEARMEKSILAMKGKVQIIKITSDHNSSQEVITRERDSKRPFGKLLLQLQAKGALKTLHTLILEGCYSITNDDLITLLGSDKSKIKTLRIKDMHYISPFELFENGFFSLESICFERISMSEQDVTRIFYSENENLLKRLEFDMSGGKFPDLWDRIEKSSNFNNLTHLAITNAQVTNESFATVHKNFVLQSLTSLDLSNNDISDITEIATVLPQLKVLNLSNSHLIKLKQLTAFVTQSTSEQNLKTLILKGCNINYLYSKSLTKMITEKGITITV